MLDHSGDDNNMVINRGWATEKPTEPGWYWVKFENGYTKIMQVHRCSLTGLLTVEDDAWLKHIVDVEWQGPLTPNEAT